MMVHPVRERAALIHFDLDDDEDSTIDLRVLDLGLVLHRKGLVVDFCLIDLRDWDGRRTVRHLLASHRPTADVVSSIAAAFSPDSEPRLPSLTVAVCTKDRPERLARLLRSVVDLDPSPLTTPLDVLVIDNAASSDATERVVAGFASVRHVPEWCVGLDFARNRALRESDSDMIAFLDDDVVVDRGWLRGLHAAWRANPDAGGFSGLVMPFALETDAQLAFERAGGFGRGPQRRRLAATIPGNSLFPLGSGMVGAGCNMAFDRRLLLSLGGFDEALDTGAPLPGGGDLDAFFRVLHSGHTIAYEPAYAVYHEHRQTVDQLTHQYFTWGLGFMSYLDKVSLTVPSERRRARLLRMWWLKEMTKELRRAKVGRATRSPDDIRAELRGGARGIAGEYRRSRRRSAEIRSGTR